MNIKISIQNLQRKKNFHWNICWLNYFNGYQMKQKK